MRFQEQRIPSTPFSQQLQAQQQAIRENLNFAGVTNRRMKEDIETARRKLNSSSSTGLLRNNAFFTHTENNRNLVNVQQRPNRSNNFSVNQTPQYTTQTHFFRKEGPEVPEEADEEFEVLRREVIEARKQNEGLKQVIAQNDASARFAISQLQGTLQTVRGENERIKMNYELLLKQGNDQKINKNAGFTEGQCLKCQKLQRRIKELQEQLVEANQKLEKQLAKKNEANQTNFTIRTELSERLRTMQQKFLKSNEQILKYESLNFELTRKLSQSQQKQFYFTEQLNNLSQQLANTSQIKQKITFDYERLRSENERLRNEAETFEKRHLETINQVAYLSNKVEAINAEIAGSEDRGKSDLTVSIGELEERVGQLRYRLQQKITENREYELRINEKDAYMKKLSEEYGECLEKIEHLQEALAHYRQNSEELQVELDRIRSQESPTNQEKAEQTANNIRLEEAIQTEYAKVQNLNQKLQQKDNTVTELRQQLEEIHNYLQTTTINSQKTVQELNITITHLYQQNETITRRNGQLEALFSQSKQQIAENNLQIVREREEIAAIREQLRRKVQYYEEALQEINKQPLTEYKTNSDLEELVYTLRNELSANHTNYSILEQRLASSESQRLRFEDFISELNSKIRSHEEQKASFESTINQYRQRVYLLQEEVTRVSRLKETSEEILISKEKEIKEISFLLEKAKSTPIQGQSDQQFYKNRLYEAQNYIEQQERVLAKVQQEVELLKEQNVSYQSIINDQLSRGVASKPVQEKLPQLQFLLKEQSKKNDRCQQTIEIQHKEIERMNALLLAKDSEIQLLRRDIASSLDQNTDLRGINEFQPTAQEYRDMENSYRKKIEDQERQNIGWSNLLNSHLKEKQDEINRLTAQIELLHSQANLQPKKEQSQANQVKLFKAERYIEELMHINAINEQTQSDQQQQIIVLQERLRTIEPILVNIQHENQQLRQKISQAESTLNIQRTAQLASLQSRLRQSEERLQGETLEGSKLRQAVETLSQQLRQQKAITCENQVNQQKATFYQQKLIDAENYIAELFEKEGQYKKIIENLERERLGHRKQIADQSLELQGAVKHIEELTAHLKTSKDESYRLSKETETIKKQLSIIELQLLNSQKSQASQQIVVNQSAEQFRQKLEIAENHIIFLENELNGHSLTIQRLQKDTQDLRRKAAESEIHQKQIVNLSIEFEGAAKHIEQLTNYSRAKDEEVIRLTQALSNIQRQPKTEAYPIQPVNNEQIEAYKAQLAQANRYIKDLLAAEAQKEQIFLNLSHKNDTLRQQLNSEESFQSKLEAAQTHIRYLQQELPSEHLQTIEKLQKYLDEAEEKAKQNKNHLQQLYHQAIHQNQILTAQFEDERNALRNENIELQNALRSYLETVPAQKSPTLEQTILSLQEQVRVLYQRNDANQQAKDQEIKVLLEKLSQIPQPSPQKPKNSDFQESFEKKLIVAEKYIQEILQVLQVNEQALIQKQEQVNSLQRLVGELQQGAQKENLAKAKEIQILKQNHASQLANTQQVAARDHQEIEGLKSRLRQADTDLTNANTKIRNLEELLKKQANEKSNQLSHFQQTTQADKILIAQLQKKIAEAAQKQEITEKKLKEQQALNKQISEIQVQSVKPEDSEFYSQKLFEAERYIEQLLVKEEHFTRIENENKEINERFATLEQTLLKSQAENQNLANNLVQVQENFKTLSKPVEDKGKDAVLIQENERMARQLKKLSQEKEFFRLKLLDAEQHIHYLTHELPNQHIVTIENLQKHLEDAERKSIVWEKKVTQSDNQSRTQLAAITQTLHITQERLRLLQSERATFQERMAELQPLVAENEKLEGQKKTLQQQGNNILQKISQMQGEINHFQKLASTHQRNLQNYREQASNDISILQKENTRLQAALAKAEEQLRRLGQIQSITEERLRSRESELINLESKIEKDQTISSVFVDESADFFRNKLLQAEAYLAQLEQQNIANEKVVVRKDEELQEATNKIVQLEEIIRNAEQQNQLFTKEIQNYQIVYQQLRDKAANEVPKADLSALQNRLKQSEEKIQRKILEGSNLRKAVQTLSQQLRQEKASNAKLNNQNLVIKEKTVFLEHKILEAQAYITELHNKQSVQNKNIENVSSQLKENFDKLKKQKDNLQLEVRAIVQERDFFKEKLGHAETHISTLEKELNVHLATIEQLHRDSEILKTKAAENDANQRQIASLSSKLQTAQKQIGDLTLKVEEKVQKNNKDNDKLLSEAKETVQERQFLKEKLTNAEEHIVYLENELLPTVQKLNKELKDTKEKANLNERHSSERISILSLEIQGAAKKIEDLTNNLKNSKEEVLRLSKENESINKQKLLLEQQIVSIQSLTNAPTKENESVSNSVEDLRPQLDAAEAHINYLENVLNGHLVTIENLHKDSEDLKKKAVQSDTNQKQIANLSSKLQAALKQIEQLTLKAHEKEDNKNNKERLLAEVKSATQERDFFKEKLGHAEAHMSTLEKELNVHLATIEQLHRDSEILKTKAAENDANQRQIASLSSKLQTAQKQIGDLTLKVEEKEDNKGDKERLLAEVKSTTQEKEFFKEKLDHAEGHIVYLEKELNNHLITIEKLHKDSEDLKKKAVQSDTNQHQVAHLSVKLQGALKHIEELTNNLQTQEKEVYRLSQALTKAASEPRSQPIQPSFSQEIDSYKTNLAKADQQIKHLVDTIAAKQQTISLLQKEFTTSKEKIHLQEQELANIQNQNKILSSELAKAEQAAKNQENGSNEDKEFFKHKLIDAEDHIAYLENHRIKELQNMVEQLEKRISEANRKAKIEAESEGNNKVQLVTLTQKISQLQILAKEREVLSAEKTILQKENAVNAQRLISLQEDKQSANERANYSENLLMDTIKQLQDLKQKMKDAQSELYNVQAENDKLKEAVKASVPTQKIYTLPEYIALEEKVKQLEEQNTHLIQVQQSRIPNLETKVEAKPAVIEEDTAFFKNKLLEAERYIEEIEHINIANQQIVNQQNDDIRNLAAKISQLEVVNANSEKQNIQLSSELKKAKDTNNQLKEAMTSLTAPEKLIALENLKKQAETKLSQKIKENESLAAQIVSLKLQTKEKDEQIKSIKAEKESSDNEAAFFKQKLFDAESYITALEEAEHSNEELNNKLKKSVEIQEELESIKNIRATLIKEIEAKTTKIATLEKTTQQLSQEGEFFKRKLLDAETHIKFLEEELLKIGNIEQTLDLLANTEKKAKEWEEKTKNIENRNKQLALMNQQLLIQLNEPRESGQIQKLEDSLVQLKSRLIESEASNRELLDQLAEERSENNSIKLKVTQTDKSDFFKEKLLQAESYINQLEQENGVLSTGIDTLKNQVETLKEECKEREKILVNLEEQINTYAEDLRESEVEREALQLRYIELEQKVDPLTKKIEILDGQLTREQEAYNNDINNLNKQIETADAKVKEAEARLQEETNNVAKLAEQKEAAQERAKKYEELSNTLQETLNLLDSIHKPFSDQEESIEQLKEQLKESEKREQELKIKDIAKDNVLNRLQAEIQKESSDNQQLREDINNLLSEITALKTENEDLNRQLQELRRIDVPVVDNESLLRNLQDEQNKYNEMMRQLEQLTDRIRLTEDENFQIKSLKEIAEKKVKQHETIIRDLEEKVRTEKQIGREDDNKKIERDFMDEKLIQAQELIAQQQNEINRLTQALIQQQNESLKYSGDLATKIEDERNLDNTVRELSNSRRLLDQKIKLLESENEAIKIEKIEQAKQLQAAQYEIQTVQETISTLLQEKAVADDLAQASKENIQDLESKFITLLSEVTQLRESIKEKDEQISLLEVNISKGKEGDIVIEQLRNREKQYQDKLSEYEREKTELQSNNNALNDQIRHYQEITANLNDEIVEKDSERIIISAEKEELRKKLQDQLSNSLRLEQQQENDSKTIEEIKERQQGLKDTISYLEKELNSSHEMMNQLLDEKVEAEQKITSLYSEIQVLKKEKENEIAPLFEQIKKDEENIASLTSELQIKTKKIEVLINEINPLNTENENLLKRSGELEQEISALKAEKEDPNTIQALVEKLQEAEGHIAQLQEENQNANQIFKNLETQIESMKDEVVNLKNQLATTNTERQKLEIALSELQNELELAQSDNEKLNSKVSYLQSVNEIKDKEIADLSEFSLNRQANANEKSNNKAEEISNPNILPDEYKDLHESLQNAKNQLEKQMKDDEHNIVKELQEQIRILTAELQKKDEENRLLMVEKVNLIEENKEVLERLNNRDLENEEELKQHLVQVDRSNFELQEYNRQLLNDLELLAKDKAYLEGEVNQLKAKDKLQISDEEPKTPERGAKKVAKPVSEPNSEGYNISSLQEEIEQLKQELAEERIRGEELLSLEVDNDALKHRKQELQDKLQTAESERLRLLLKLKEAQELISQLQNAESAYKLEEEQLLKEKSQLQENLNLAERRINKLEEKGQGQTQQSQQSQASLGENIKKILDLTRNFNEEIEPEDITQHLQSYPYLNELITSILYRLRLSTALELEKSIKIKQLTEELANAQKSALEASDLRNANEFLKREIERLEQEFKDREFQDQEKYEEVLNELVFYEAMNKELEGKVKEISEQYQQQKERLDGYQKQITNPVLENSSLSPQENDLSRENYELRRKLESSERAIQKIKDGADSSESMNTKDVFYLEFLNTCLDKVVDLQREVQEVEREIEQAAVLENSQRNTSSRNEDGKGSDSVLQDKLQQLEDKLMKNAQNIRQHQQRSDNELFELLKELSEVKELPQFNKNKIDDYLTQLENQILKDHDLHINEVSRLREQLAASQEQSGRSNESLEEFSRVNKEKLLKQINNLNNTIEIYHQQSMRRKKNYKRTIESLLRDIEKLRERQETLVTEGKSAYDEPLNEAVLEITDKLRYAIEKDEEEDSKQIDLGEDDFIISNNYVQILDGREKENKHLSGLQENFGEYMERNVETAEVQTEEDHKPFLSFILSNQNLDKEDIRLLKKKIADMRAKEVQENLQALRAQEKKLEEVLMMNNRENPQQLDNIILTLANNYSRDEISQIFGSQDQDQILNKLNEALCMEDSFYKGENSSTMMKDIQERMLRHYETPTKLSEEVYNHLINLLSAKKDEQFYDEIELLFRDLYEIEAGFEEALRKKDELYKVHNERMNQIFNRSSSDGSEEYLTIFERENNEEPLQMHSQRKPRNSEAEEDAER